MNPDVTLPAEYLAAAEQELFRARFTNWRWSLVAAGALVLIVGGLFRELTPAPLLPAWMVTNLALFALIGLLCQRYERAPPQHARAERRWLAAWVVLALLSGAASGALPGCLPDARTDLMLLAALIVSVFLIAQVATRGHRAIIFALVAGQTASLSAVLALHAHLPRLVLLCVLFAGFVLVFALLLNRALLLAFGQRLQVQALMDELERSHARELAAKQAESAMRARHGMIEDLHDGVGSALLSALLQLERDAAAPASVVDTVRDCIDELRALIDAHEAEDDCAALLGMFRGRFEQRARVAGLEPWWQMDELPDDAGLNAAQSLELLRILQEASANALRHARAHELGFTARVHRDHLLFSVTDDGCGFDCEAAGRAGRGLTIMQARARRLGGRLSVISEAGRGTEVRLMLPMAAGRDGDAGLEARPA